MLYKCRYCDRWFKRLRQYKKHMETDAKKEHTSHVRYAMKPKDLALSRRLFTEGRL